MSTARRFVNLVRSVVFLMVMLLSTNWVDGAALTAEEISQIENEFGITLTAQEKTDLAADAKPDAPYPQWRIDADARIELHRKANLDVQVVDSVGTPVPGAQVAVTLKSSAFKFGGTFSAKDFAGVTLPGTMTTQTYKDRLMSMFNGLGLNNGFKPRLTSIHEYTDLALNWTQSNEIPMRGHLCIWPGTGDIATMDTPGSVPGTDYGQHLSQGWSSDYASGDVLGAVETYKSSARTQADKDALKAEVDAEIANWAGQWDVYEWDVINETLSNKLLMEILGDQEMAEWFKIAESNAVNPDCKLLINDYQIISAMSESRTSGWYTNRRDRYMANINQIIADGGRVDRIGFQSRIKQERRDAQLIYDRLEEWGNAYGLEMVGTEFEVIDSNPGDWKEYIYTAEERAQITEEMVTQYYSHPLVTGFYAWNTINDDIEALVDYSGRPTRNGFVWYYLHRIRYMTDTNDTTDVAGVTTVRGFTGDHDITVSYGGKNYPATLTLSSNQTAVVVLNDVTLNPGPGSSSRLIEVWQMNETNGALFSALANDVGSAQWDGDKPNVATLNENLRFSQGNSTTDNIYRNATLSQPNVTSGLYELSFTFSAATIAGGDASGANVGFGLRDEGVNTDLFLIRIQRQSNKLLLQTRIGSANTTIHDFGGGVSSLPDAVSIRAVVDLDADRMDLYYAIGSAPETLAADIDIIDGEMDAVRMVATLNTTDFGATDFVDVDYVSLRSLNWISADGLYDEWSAVYPGIGSATNLMDNPDGDLPVNLAEYALGGNPANGADVGYVPANTLLMEGGTNYFKYVYARRNDAADRGLTYSLELTDDLLSGSWTNGNVEVIGTGTLDAEFDSVTNLVPSVGGDQGYIRLRIEYYK